MVMLVDARRTGMPGHEVALQPRYTKQPINIPHLSLVSKIPGYSLRYVGVKMAGGSTFFTTASRLSEHSVKLEAGAVHMYV